MPEGAVVADFHDLCGECPVWNAGQSTLTWIDITGGKLLRLDWTTRRAEIVKSGVAINGFRQNCAGGLVITNNQGVWLWDEVGEFTPVVAEVEGQPCQLNDCAADSAGRLITASYFYNPAGEYPLGSLVSVSSRGEARILDEGFHLANGLGFSPGQNALYFADSAARRIYSYDYDVNTGLVRNRRVLVEVPGDEGLPDGLAVDAEGFIWSAQWYGGCLVRYDPEGKVERRLPIPAKQTSSLAFGGSDLTDIFITSAAQSELMPIMPPGYDPQSGNFGGALYHINLGIAGQKQYAANITPRAKNE